MTNELVQLVHGNFKDVIRAIKPGIVDLIYTDPPYARATLHLYDELLHCAAPVLRPGGVLCAIIPQFAIPDVGAWTEASGLKWRWLINMDQNEGPHPRMCNGAHNIEVTGKCLGWWYKPGGPKDFSSVKDSFKNDPKKNPQHPWEQSMSWAEYGLRSFVRNGGLVLDPMVGTGTMLEACLRAGVRGIGCDLDPVKLSIARDRVAYTIADIERLDALAKAQLRMFGEDGEPVAQTMAT
ncbi:MAG: DNA methyltransferase [Armatimonadota bacterium]